MLLPKKKGSFTRTALYGNAQINISLGRIQRHMLSDHKQDWARFFLRHLEKLTERNAQSSFTQTTSYQNLVHSSHTKQDLNGKSCQHLIFLATQTSLTFTWAYALYRLQLPEAGSCKDNFYSSPLLFDDNQQVNSRTSSNS